MWNVERFSFECILNFNEFVDGYFYENNGRGSIYEECYKFGVFV